MENVAKQSKLTQNQVDDLKAPLALDLIAVFSLIQEDMLSLLDDAIDNGWTTDTLIKKMGEII